jgi:hypothetical protein
MSAVLTRPGGVAEKLGDRKYAVADIEALFRSHRHDPEAVMRSIEA